MIMFQTPLTLITGHNGAGKTTIIECLNYAMTGEMPPNSKQGAFVNDPKKRGAAVTMAKVMLAFTGIQQTTVSISRRVQLTLSRDSASLKTVDSSIRIKDASGNIGSTSKRCSEMDLEVPLQLGVSKTILQNVIFCHQEDSLWPLSEPATLKKKFDEIFDSTKCKALLLFSIRFYLLFRYKSS